MPTHPPVPPRAGRLGMPPHRWLQPRADSGTRRRPTRSATGVIALCTSALLALAACSSNPEPSPTQTHIPTPDARTPIRTNARPGGPSLLPADLSDETTRTIASLLYRGLTTHDAKGRSINALATSITSTDNTSWTIRINPNAQFWDGTAIDATTFANSWAFTSARTARTAMSTPLSRIAGYPGDGKSLAGVSVVNPTTLRIRLSAATPRFQDSLGDPTTMPMSPAALRDPTTAATRPIGNGPYTLTTEWTGKGEYTLRPSGVYNGTDKPVNAGITFHTFATLNEAYEALVAGQLDVIDELPPERAEEVTSRSDLTVSRQPVGMSQSLDFPQAAPNWAGAVGAARRLAISQSIDRAATAGSSFHGARAAATDLSSPVVEGYSNDACGTACDFDAAQAVQTWRAAGALDHIDIAYSADGSDEVAVGALCAAITATLGPSCAGKAYPDPQRLAAAVRDGTVNGPYLRTWRMRTRSLAGFLVPRSTAGAYENWGSYQGALAQLQLQVAASAATTSADAAYGTAQQLILSSLPSIPVWTVNATTTSSTSVDPVLTDAAGVPIYGQIARPRA